jgi:hypothetical protein
MAQAGWYPSGDGVERWFDGERWTDKTRPVSNAPLPPLPAEPPKKSSAPKPPPSSTVYNPKMDTFTNGATAKKGGIPWGCLGCIGIIVVPLIIFGIYSATRDKSGDQAEMREVQAKIACEDRVKDLLKAPSTASFSGWSTRGSGATYTVDGSVDAENSFGANIRSDFQCTVTFAGDRATVTVSGLN